MILNSRLLAHNIVTFLHDALALPEMGRVDLAKNISRTLVKKNTPIQFKDYLFVNKNKIKIFNPEIPISWEVLT